MKHLKVEDGSATTGPVGRTVAIGVGGGPSWAYTYDGAGQLVSVTENATGTG